jgi:glutathione S-transferase
VDILKGEHQTAEFLAVNPCGFVPALLTPEGDALYEAAALMVYLADRHGLTDLAPAVTDARRGIFLSTVFHIAGDIQSELKRFYYPHRFSLRREDEHGIRELARSGVLGQLDVLNARLGKSGPYVIGDRFSLADFLLSFWLAFFNRDVMCEKFPSLAKLYDLVKARPGATRYIEDVENDANIWGRI